MNDMAYRNIFIANTAKLSAKNEQLIVDNGEIFSFPIEDVRCVLIEDYRSTVSTALLSKFAEAGVTVLICNEKHIPTAALNPINCYSRQLRQIKNQTAQTLPSKKKLWQQIVIAKIDNQARCLRIMKKTEAEKVQALSKSVLSGDPSNVEGRAAAMYFKALFGKDFKRGEENAVNAALDYGYAILRAIISRTVCLYGLEPSLGIHHCSELNNFNLSDDIIEPYRPFIDLVVAKNMFDYDVFETADKAALLKSINACIKIDGKKQCVAYAVEKTVQSYSESLKEKTPVILPTLIDLEFNQYE